MDYKFKLDNRKTIFIADDCMLNRTVAQSILSGLYNVNIVSSTLDLLILLEKQIPNLILLDVEMPIMNGFEALKYIKANSKTSNIPVIFVTAMTSEKAAYEGFELGAVDYITKPFSAPLLLKRIEVFLLIENQKRELLNHLHKKEWTILEFKKTILRILADLVECRDEITGGHLKRTSGYIRILINAIRETGICESDLSGIDEDLLLQSCQLHDIGKISIKDTILLKNDKLTADEFECIKTHTVRGGQIISGIIEKTTDSAFLKYAKIFAETHHEKWDGTGYPNRLKGSKIPLIGRIMAIADVYDALISERPYKQIFSHPEAAAIILTESGTHFDPALVELFKDFHAEFEIISKERSNTGKNIKR